MLKLPASAEYGLLAAVHLTERYPSGDVTRASDIAGRWEIPLAYLERILAQLRGAGLIESFRGPGGGHRLASDPAGISIGTVLEALTGTASAPQDGRLQPLWTRCEQALHEAVSGSLVALAAEVQAGDGVETYQI